MTQTPGVPAGSTGDAAPVPAKQHSWLSSLLDWKASPWTPSEGWVTVGLLLALNLVVIVTVERSAWVFPMPRLWMIAILGLLASLGAAKYRGPWLLQVLLHLGVLSLGVAVAIAETAAPLSGTTGQKLGEFSTRFQGWITAISSEGISNDLLPLICILVAATWLMTYLSTLFTFRLRWTWLAVIPAAMALMTNQTYLPSRMYPIPLFFFLLFAILLMGRTHFLRRSADWEKQVVDRRTRRHAFLINSVVLTTLVLAASWVIPTREVTIQPLQDTYKTARAPWRGMEDQFERVFAGVPARRSGPLHTFGVALPLRGSIGLSSTPFMTITTDFPQYWRGQTYDFYEGRGWIANQGQRESIQSSQLQARKVEGYKKREAVAQQVLLKDPSDVLFAGGDPQDVNIDAQIEVAVPPVFEISLKDSAKNADLPPDLLDAANSITASRGAIREMRDLLPPGTRIVNDTRDSVTVTRAPSEVPDILAIRSGRRLKAGAKYEVMASVSIATEQDLRGDATAYPGWLTDSYLQLPPGLPGRVRDLARDITRGSSNPYDKALAIQQYLGSYEETLSLQPPPLNVDAVDYFLFTQKAGYSDYFASAMAVLLRASGVPARLSTGYAPGLFDEQTSTFTVRYSDAHSWPEVYFPSYGWIPFEPSPSMQPLLRGPLHSLEDLAIGGGQQNIGPLPDDLSDLLDSPLPDRLTPRLETPAAEVFASIARKAGLAFGGLAGLALAAALLLVALWQVNFIGLAHAPGLYSRMAKLGALAWRGPDQTETPTEYASALAGALELRREPAETIARGFMKSRYGSTPPSADERIEMERAWSRIRRPLMRRFLHRFNPLELLRREG